MNYTKLLYRLFIFHLFKGYSLSAQEAFVDEEIRKVDNLIENNQFELAQKKTDSL